MSDSLVERIENAIGLRAQEELEMLAQDCDDLAFDAHDDKGMSNAICSISYRIRHIAKKLADNT